MSEWILCKDKMPEVDREIIACADYFCEPIFVCLCSDTDKNKFDFFYWQLFEFDELIDVEFDDVYAWQYIPKKIERASLL